MFAEMLGTSGCLPPLHDEPVDEPPPVGHPDLLRVLVPLGPVAAVEFRGPLTVAAVRSSSARALTWPALALLGVVLLTEPWQENMNVAGLGFAALAAIGWAFYILLSQRIGDRFTGLGGLSLAVPIAAATAALLGVPQAAGHLTGWPGRRKRRMSTTAC